MSIVLPGFIVVLGFAHESQLLQTWLGDPMEISPTVGGFLFLTVASIFAGLTASTVRWLAIDSFHALTGLKQPDWDFSRLSEQQEGFQTLINIHYRFYQFYANSIVALILFGIVRWMTVGFRFSEFLAITLICTLFFLGSRDSLRKYFFRVEALLNA